LDQCNGKETPSAPAFYAMWQARESPSLVLFHVKRTFKTRFVPRETANPSPPFSAGRFLRRHQKSWPSAANLVVDDGKGDRQIGGLVGRAFWCRIGDDRTVRILAELPKTQMSTMAAASRTSASTVILFDHKGKRLLRHTTTRRARGNLSVLTRRKFF
jgi:hypothetical protein